MMGLHAVDFLRRKSLEVGGTLLIDDLDSHLCPGQKVSAQPHLEKLC